MTDQHDRIKQDLAAYALGSLDSDDVEAVERHLATCDECRALLEDYRRAAALMPLALEFTEAPAGAEARLLAAARASGRPEDATGHDVDILRTRSAGWVLAAAALLLLAVILGSWLIWLQLDDDGGSLEPGGGERIVALSGSPDAPEASGHLVLDEDEPRATLVVSNLPAVPAGRAYQFWFVGPGGERVSGAVFSTGPDGGAVVEVDVPENVTAYERIGVTEEPKGGSEGPTGTNVLGGALREAG